MPAATKGTQNTNWLLCHGKKKLWIKTYIDPLWTKNRIKRFNENWTKMQFSDSVSFKKIQSVQSMPYQTHNVGYGSQDWQGCMGGWKLGKPSPSKIKNVLFMPEQTFKQIYKVSGRMSKSSAQKGTVGRQVRSGLQVWTQDAELEFLYFVVYVLTCDKGKEWVAMPSWNFAWAAQRCQGACFCSPANDLFAVSFVKQINLDQAQNQMCNGQETFCLFDCGHWYCIPITSPSFFSVTSLTRQVGCKTTMLRSILHSKCRSWLISPSLICSLLAAFHG